MFSLQEMFCLSSLSSFEVVALGSYLMLSFLLVPLIKALFGDGSGD